MFKVPFSAFIGSAHTELTNLVLNSKWLIDERNEILF
jgi:hypothetical protein